MPDWLAPFHLPKFTDDQFETQKEAYTEKYGYTVTVPSFDDIILIKRFKNMTREEIKLWKQRKYDEIPAGRLAKIREHKEAKRQKFVAMLASPSPKIVRSVGAIMTSLDDVQDAVSTLAVIGLITAAVIGGTTAAVLTGPLGWIVGASTLLNLINPYSRIRGPKKKAKTGRAAQRSLEKLTDKNPFSKKARLKTTGWWRHMKPPEGMTIPPGVTFPKGWRPGDKFPKGVIIKKGTKIPWGKIKKFRPSVGNAIEALQVTAGVFGIGLSLGPIMGFAQDYIAGAIRAAAGQKVTFVLPPEKWPEHYVKAARASKANAVLHGYKWESDFQDEVDSFLAAQLSLQVLEPYLQDWNPMEEVEDLASFEIQAPRPTDILTLEIIEEAGYTLDEVCNWPQTGEQWITLGDLQEMTAETATANLTHFAEENKNSALAFIAGQNAHDFALGALAAWEDPEQVEIEYLPTSRIVITILMNGWCYPDDVTDAQVQKFEDWVGVHEYMGSVPTGKEIRRYAEVFCEFSWAKSEDEYI